MELFGMPGNPLQAREPVPANGMAPGPVTAALEASVRSASTPPKLVPRIIEASNQYLLGPNPKSAPLDGHMSIPSVVPPAAAAGTDEPATRSRRKGHTKSRRGCYSCKRRKVKCPETKPICDHCQRLGLPCRYPRPTQMPEDDDYDDGSGSDASLVYSHEQSNSSNNSRHHHRRATLTQRTTTTHMESATISMTTALEAAAAAGGGEMMIPQAFSNRLATAVFSLQDLRFFQHFLVRGYPGLPIGADAMWQGDVAAMAHQFDFLAHALLGLGASHLGVMLGGSSGEHEPRGMHVPSRNTGIPDPEFDHAALAHRVQAIALLNRALGEPCRSTAALNAQVAALLVLAFQAACMEDGMLDFITMIRGCAIVVDHHRNNQSQPQQHGGGSSPWESSPAPSTSSSSQSLSTMMSAESSCFENGLFKAFPMMVASANSGGTMMQADVDVGDLPTMFRPTMPASPVMDLIRPEPTKSCAFFLPERISLPSMPVRQRNSHHDLSSSSSSRMSHNLQQQQQQKPPLAALPSLPLDANDVAVLLASLREVQSLCRTPMEHAFAASIESALLLVPTSIIAAFGEMCAIYRHFMDSSHDAFADFTRPDNHAAQLLLGYFFLFELVIGTTAMGPAVVSKSFSYRGRLVMVWLDRIRNRLPEAHRPCIERPLGIVQSLIEKFKSGMEAMML